MKNNTLTKLKFERIFDDKETDVTAVIASQRECVPKVESASYHVPDTVNHRRRMSFMESKHVLYSNLLDWLGTSIIAISVALSVLFIQQTFDFFSSKRNHFVHSFITEDPKSLFVTAFVDIALFLLILGLGCLISAYEPQAVGSGIPGIIAFLNGLRVPGLLTMKALACRSLGIICTVASGLQMGTVGPIAHIGASIGLQVNKLFKKFRAKLEQDPQIHPFRSGAQSHDADERDAVSTGAGCGLTALFSSPIGGALFALEEASSFLEVDAIRRGFYGTFLTFGIVSVYQGWNSTFNFLAERPSNPLCNDRNVAATDVVLFIVIGVLGGLFGALFNSIVKKISSINWQTVFVSVGPKKVVQKRIVFTLLLGILVSLTRVFLPLAFECKDLESRLFLEHPSFCLGMSTERRMFSGMAYFGSGSNISTTYESKFDCEDFSSKESYESFQKKSLFSNEEDLEIEDIGFQKLFQNPEDWSPTKPGLRSMGKLLPIPLKGVYNLEEKGVPINMIWTVQYTCKPGQFNPMASLIFNTIGKTVRLIFVRGSPKIIPLDVLITYFIVYFTIVVISVSAAFITGGAILPEIVLGATYGRIVGYFGTYAREIMCSKWLYLPALMISEKQRLAYLAGGGQQTCLRMCSTATDPLLYAVVGAASFMGGVQRSPLFCIVVISELINDMDSLPSIALGVFVSMWVGNLFNRGMYHSLIDLKIPLYLDKEPPISYEGVAVTKVMSTPIAVLPSHVSKSDLLFFLQDDTRKDFNGFPVVKSMENRELLGIISKQKLMRMLKLHENTTTDQYGRLSENRKLMRVFGRKGSTEDILTPSTIAFNIQKTINDDSVGFVSSPAENAISSDLDPTIILKVKTSSDGSIIDLTQNLDQSPYCVFETFSLARVYRLFRKEGLRHVLVVDANYCPVGMVTRQNLNAWKFPKKEVVKGLV